MGATPREERLAKNEAMFRAANERMNDWEERHGEHEREPYYCECAEPGCTKKISMTEEDYERGRENSRRFFVIEGHEIPEIETVIERHEGWLMVEKRPETDHIVGPLDPRS